MPIHMLFQSVLCCILYLLLSHSVCYSSVTRCQCALCAVATTAMLYRPRHVNSTAVTASVFIFLFWINIVDTVGWFGLNTLDITVKILLISVRVFFSALVLLVGLKCSKRTGVTRVHLKNNHEIRRVSGSGSLIVTFISLVIRGSFRE